MILLCELVGLCVSSICSSASGTSSREVQLCCLSNSIGACGARLLPASILCGMQEFWPKLTGLKWLHSCSAGLEHLLFPELVNSPVVLTNAKGVYSHSLAE